MTKRKRVVVLAVLLLAMIAAAVYGGVFGVNRANRGGVSVSGNIEVVDVELSFKIPGRVQERLVDEGEKVEPGQVVARLESAELAQEAARRQAEFRQAEAFLSQLETGARDQERRAAEAAVDVAKARLNELLSGSRPQEITAASADLQAARAEAERLRNDEQRITRLREENAVSAQQSDAVRAAAAVAGERARSAQQKAMLVKEGPRKEQIEQAQAALRQAQEQYALVMEGPRQEEIAQARAKVDQAKAAAELAGLQLKNATIISPIAGIVLSKNVEPGEYVAPGTPVVTVGDLAHVWLRAYIDEADLGRIKVGQKAEVTTDTYAERIYPGIISFLASEAEFTPKTVQTAKERVKLVYRIKIDIENPKMELKPGMPADAVVETD